MRVLCAAVSGHGHAYPMLAAAAGCARAGHDAVVALEPRFAGAANAAGVEFVPLPSVEPRDPRAFRPYELALDQARAFRAAVAAIRPDVALADLLALGPALACEAQGVPWASLSIHPLHLPSADLPPFGSGRGPHRGPFGRRRDDRARRNQMTDLLRARDDCSRARVELGLGPVDRLDASLSPDLILVATLPALEIPRRDWPPRARVIGPLLWEPADAPVVPWPNGDGPRVLIAASTAHAGPLVAAATNAAERIGARAVVTVGSSGAPPVGDPARVTVTGEASHAALLRGADVVVCAGGHGIVARALSAGAPLVVAPRHGDQHENAYRVRRAGAGIALRGEPGPRAIARAIRRVLRDPGFRTRAGAAATQAAGLDAGAAVAAAMEELGAKKMGGGRVPAPLPNGGF